MIKLKTTISNKQSIKKKRTIELKLDKKVIKKKWMKREKKFRFKWRIQQTNNNLFNKV